MSLLFDYYVIFVKYQMCIIVNLCNRRIGKTGNFVTRNY